MGKRIGFLKSAILVCGFFVIAGGPARADIVPVGGPLFLSSLQNNFCLTSNSKFYSIKLHSEAGSSFATTVISNIWLWDVDKPLEFSYRAFDRDNNRVEEGHFRWDDKDNDGNYEWSGTNSVPEAGSTLLFLALAITPLAAGYRRRQK
jgi:hypothetical protein